MTRSFIETKRRSPADHRLAIAIGASEAVTSLRPKIPRSPTAPSEILAAMPQPLRAQSREVLRVARGLTPTHEHLRSRLIFLFLATVVLDAVATVLVFFFERHAHGTEITTWGDSLFWTSTQLLTVSSQLPNPISTPARILDVFLQAYAISAVAILAGSFGAFFHRRGNERDPPESPRRAQAGADVGHS